MSGPALLQTISFVAFVVMILLTVWIILLLESGGHSGTRRQAAAKLTDGPRHGTAPERQWSAGSRPVQSGEMETARELNWGQAR